MESWDDTIWGQQQDDISSVYTANLHDHLYNNPHIVLLSIHNINMIIIDS